jgi:hypothetical protein
MKKNRKQKQTKTNNKLKSFNKKENSYCVDFRETKKVDLLRLKSQSEKSN